MDSFRVGIVGSGVSSLYLVSNIIKRLPNVKIDIFESNKYPFGLLRTSVSPQSVEFKSLIPKFTQILHSPNVNLHLNFKIDDIFISRLSSQYNAVVSAVGGGEARRLPEFNYDNQCRISSDCFTRWYNGFIDLNLPKQKNPRIGIIGYGNVSLDVASYFLTPSCDIRHLSYSLPAKEYINCIEKAYVSIVGRKSISNSSFSLNELRSFSAKNRPILINDNTAEKHPKTRCVTANSCSTSRVKLISNIGNLEYNDSSNSIVLRSSGFSLDLHYDILITCIGNEPNLSFEDSTLKTGWALNGKGNIAISALSSSQVAEKIAQMHDGKLESNPKELFDSVTDSANLTKYDWFFLNSCEEVLGNLRETCREVVETDEIERYLFKTMRMWRSSLK